MSLEIEYTGYNTSTFERTLRRLYANSRDKQSTTHQFCEVLYTMNKHKNLTASVIVATQFMREQTFSSKFEGCTHALTWVRDLIAERLKHNERYERYLPQNRGHYFEPQTTLDILESLAAYRSQNQIIEQ